MIKINKMYCIKCLINLEVIKHDRKFNNHVNENDHDLFRNYSIILVEELIQKSYLGIYFICI